jgi:hypothetical protein
MMRRGGEGEKKVEERRRRVVRQGHHHLAIQSTHPSRGPTAVSSDRGGTESARADA